MKTYCLALDLKDDPALIAEYRRYHQRGHIWPRSSKCQTAGHSQRANLLLGTRMVMVLNTTDDFIFEDVGAAHEQVPTGPSLGCTGRKMGADGKSFRYRPWPLWPTSISEP